MSYTGEQNQQRLYAGYQRVAEQLGTDHVVYPFRLLDPLNINNVGSTIKSSFTADPGYHSPLKYNKPVWIAYLDGNLVNQFDFLSGDYGTYYIADKQPMQPMQAVRTNRILSLSRGSYSTEGEVTENVVKYADLLPAFMQFAREDIQRPNTQFGQQIGRATTHWTAFIPAPDGSISQDDIAIDEYGIKYVIDAPDFTNAGYVVRLRLATV